MARFSKQINLDVTELRGMDTQQKQECLYAINKRLKVAWYYSILLSLLIMVFIFIYSLISTMYTLKSYEKLEPIGVMLFFAPAIIFIPAFMANMMKKWALILSIFAYTGLALYLTVQNNATDIWVAPFALAGAVITFRLITCSRMYEALKKEPNFPDFCTLEEQAEAAKEIINRKKEEPVSLNILTETAIMAAKIAESRKAEAEQSAKETLSEAPVENQ